MPKSKTTKSKTKSSQITLPQKEQFKEWLIKRGKTAATGRRYANCMDVISAHYSKKTGKSTNIYDVKGTARISEIARQYGQSGDYAKAGDTHRGRWRNAVARYAEFCADQWLSDSNSTPSDSDSSQKTDSAPVNFEYERDLQTVFCAQISALFPGYNIVGRERPIRGKRIDVLLEHADNKNLLVVELKAGKADEAVFGQISMYIGMLQSELGLASQKIKGVVIANAISNGLRDARKTNKNISLKTYRMSLELEDADLPDSEDGDV